jgi:hypothetical protein
MDLLSKTPTNPSLHATVLPTLAVVRGFLLVLLCLLESGVPQSTKRYCAVLCCAVLYCRVGCGLHRLGQRRHGHGERKTKTKTKMKTKTKTSHSVCVQS